MNYPQDDSYIEILNNFPDAKVYWVGGCVRDMMMNRPSSDIDYVVTGITGEQLKSIGFDGHGTSFYVYIHPRTKCEIALARTERKVGVGYTGFEVSSSPTITIEQDLYRRDLTINAIAIDCQTKHIVDPWNGAADIANRILRPVSEHFKEDPVRSLRVARFIARFGSDWEMDHHTYTYTSHMRFAGEFDTIPSSRVLGEIEDALNSPYPELFFDTMHYLGISHLYNDAFDSNYAHLVVPYKQFPLIDKLVAICIDSSVFSILKYNVGDGEQTTEFLVEHGESWFHDVQMVEYAVRHLRLFNHASRVRVLINATIIHNPAQETTLRAIENIIYNVSKMSLTTFQSDGTITQLPEDRTTYGHIVMECKVKRLLSLLGDIKIDSCSN